MRLRKWVADYILKEQFPSFRLGYLKFIIFYMIVVMVVFKLQVAQITLSILGGTDKDASLFPSDDENIISTDKNITSIANSTPKENYSRFFKKSELIPFESEEYDQVICVICQENLKMSSSYDDSDIVLPCRHVMKI